MFTNPLFMRPTRGTNQKKRAMEARYHKSVGDEAREYQREPSTTPWARDLVAALRTTWGHGLSRNKAKALRRKLRG